jgi:hypothetical protein
MMYLFKFLWSFTFRNVKTNFNIQIYSSEDEDFFDAEDENEVMEEEEDEGTDGLVGTPKATSNAIAVAVRERSVDVDVADHLPSSEDSIDYDALYEEADNDEEDVDMKSHGSVITHLLSQVRIGKDSKSLKT